MSTRVVPANEATCEDLDLVFGPRGECGRCRCQTYKLGYTAYHGLSQADRIERHRDQANCGDDRAPETSGLVLYVDDEPAGWCAVEPRVNYPYLRKTTWTQRTEDRDDESVWSLTCFVIRRGYRRQGLMTVLAEAAVEHARSRGARLLEAYPMITEPGKEITWGELSVGSRNALADAGFEEILHPSKRRYIMQVVF